MKKPWLLIKRFLFEIQKNEFLRFLVVGAVNTLFGFFVYSLFIYYDVEVWLALLGGTIAGLVFNFFTTGGYVFRDISLGKVPGFMICHLVIYGINLSAIKYISGWVGDKTIAQFILIIPMALLSYFLLTRLVFSRKRAQAKG